MAIDDEYTAFCFDEACLYIEGKIKDGEKPIFKIESEYIEKPHYKTASQMYDALGYKNNSYVKTNPD